jgi:hypothetical protein
MGGVVKEVNKPNTTSPTWPYDREPDYQLHRENQESKQNVIDDICSVIKNLCLGTFCI